MSKTLRCAPCSGSGQVMGGGMVMKDCDNCFGKGKITIEDDSYNKAKENIKALNEDITDQKAEEILNKEIMQTTSNPKLKVINNDKRKK